MSRRAIWTGVLAIIAASLVVALSFVATPVKFAASDVPLGHLLAVGRVTFRASLACEIAILLPRSLVAQGKRRLVVGAAAAILAAQWLVLMPTLDTRALALMAGGTVAPSSLHRWWIAADVIRIVLYGAVARLSLAAASMVIRRPMP